MAIAASLKTLAAAKCGVKKGDLYRVEASLLLEEPGFNLRHYTRPDVVAHIEALAHAYAQKLPVPGLVVRVDPDGRIFVIEGHCRRRAALLAQSRGHDVDPLDCVAFRGTDAERVEIMLRSAQSLPLAPLEVALGYARLRDLGYTQVQISQALCGDEHGEGARRVTPARVEQLLLLADADPAIHDMVALGHVSADVAIEAIRVHRQAALAFLQEKLLQAQGVGKSKVTRQDLQAPKLPSQVAQRVSETVSSVMQGLGKQTLREIAQLAALSDAERRGKTVTVSADAMVLLLAAQQSAEDARAKQATRLAEKAAAAAQQPLIEGVDP